MLSGEDAVGYRIKRLHSLVKLEMWEKSEVKLFVGGTIQRPVLPWISDIVLRCAFISKAPPIHL